jgi:hypothetical protein
VARERERADPLRRRSEPLPFNGIAAFERGEIDRRNADGRVPKPSAAA